MRPPYLGKQEIGYIAVISLSWLVVYFVLGGPASIGAATVASVSVYIYEVSAPDSDAKPAARETFEKRNDAGTIDFGLKITVLVQLFISN